MSPVSRNRPKAPSFKESFRRNRQSTAAKRISNRQLAKRADYSIQQGSQVFSLLLAVLAQCGSVIVTKGTMEQVAANIRNLNFVVEPMKPLGDATDITEFRVALVDNTPKPAETTITKIADDGTDDAGEAPSNVETAQL